jgi:CheY-like chemotaxis protein
MTAKHLPTVLLVEDSPDDIDFARRALAKSGVAHRLVVAEQGDQALALLSRRHGDGHAGPLRPALILLDLNVPGMSGRELLARIKSDPQLCAIPVAILSTSQHPADIESCYRAHANSYHYKSDDLTHYQNTVRQIVEYWLVAVAQPKGTAELSLEPIGDPADGFVA